MIETKLNVRTCGTALAILALAFAAIQPSHSHADAPAAGASAADLAKLREDHVTTLRRAAEIAYKMYSQGIGTLDDVDRLDRLLIEAELDSATSQNQRIDFLQDALTTAKRQEEAASRAAAAGVVTALAPLETKAYRLEIEIKLAQETDK